MRSLLENVRRSHKVVALFGLMVLLPAVVFGVLIVRAVRSERARLAYDRAQRQQQIVQFVEADLRSWLFSPGPGAARGDALVRFDIQADRIVFPDFQLSWPASESPQLRPAEAGPPSGPPTAAVVTEHYFPRIQAFRRDTASGRNAGIQYFRQLRALVVQPPDGTQGYVLDIRDVLAHVNGRLAEWSASEPFAATAWMAAERTSRPPAGSFSIEGFPFLEVVFDERTAGGLLTLRGLAFPSSMAALVLVTVLGSVFVYRAVSHEARLARLRSDFVAAVSHEFRSPLSSILALAERLERVGDAEKLREYHRIIGQDARRLSALVTRLLDFALIEEGRQPYARERVDLVATAREAIEACQHVARPERIRLLGADAAPLWVLGDRTALQHAIQNVIENAAKYSPPDAPIVVECARVDGSHVVSVRDRGIGIPREEQARIFDKFYRGRHVSGMNVQGVGIGLALVRHVVDGHGGSVAVESEPGAGSRFELRLPGAAA
ncbi:MAG: HAMP domain-containing histidine kinase [Acidobacteria bacterium]|nr:HAMP domain-containing histidine kinase [Acidobacteriota bacterium]